MESERLHLIGQPKLIPAFPGMTDDRLLVPQRIDRV